MPKKRVNGKLVTLIQLGRIICSTLALGNRFSPLRQGNCGTNDAAQVQKRRRAVQTAQRLLMARTTLEGQLR